MEQSDAVQIRKTHLGEIEDYETIESVEAVCMFAGGDFALELRGKSLHIFRIFVGVR